MKYVDMLENLYFSLNGGMPLFSIPGKNDIPLVKKLNAKDYSDLTLLTTDTKIEIIDCAEMTGAFGIIYSGKCNNISCLIKISYDKIGDIPCQDYKKSFIELNNILLQQQIIPTFYSYNHIEDFETIQMDDIEYDKNKYIEKLRVERNRCIYILCMEQYDCDLVKLYNINLLIKNKLSIEQILLVMFDRLNKLKYFFIDMKLENVVVKLNDNEVSDLKIIDIDPIYCLPYDDVFDMSNTNELEISTLVTVIYKQIFNSRSASILFKDDVFDKNIYNKFCDKLKETSKNSYVITIIRNLLSSYLHNQNNQNNQNN